jgi:hypothetical protein
MNKFRLNRIATVGLLSIAITAITVIHLTNVHAEKTGLYSQSGGTVTETGKTYSATSIDQSSILVTDSGTYTLTDSVISKTGDSSSVDDSNFGGLNAGVAAEKASQINLSNCTITTNAKGANAVFARDKNSSITLSNVTIKTSADSSRGLYGIFYSTITAKNCNVTTTGEQDSPAIASNVRNYKPTINVSGGTFTTSGAGSPPVHCLGAYTIDGAILKGNNSEAAIIENTNSITATNCTMSGKKCGVLIYRRGIFESNYQPNGTFIMNGGSLTASDGPVFLVTNQTGIINLNAAALTSNSGVLLKAAADHQWGDSGSIGSKATLTATSQTMTGDMICDKLSSITATLKNTSKLTGAINSASLNLDATSTWNVTGDSYLTSFVDADTTMANIDDNGHTIYYDSSLSNNSWLNSQTYYLTDGGKLTPGTSPTSSATVSVSASPSPTVCVSSDPRSTFWIPFYPESTARPSVSPRSSAGASMNPRSTFWVSFLPRSTARPSVYPRSSARASMNPRSTFWVSFLPRSTAKPSVYPRSSAGTSFSSGSTYWISFIPCSTAKPSMRTSSALRNNDL